MQPVSAAKVKYGIWGLIIGAKPDSALVCGQCMEPMEAEA